MRGPPKRRRRRWRSGLVSKASHLALAILSGVVLATSSLLPLDPPNLIVCGFLRITGFPCPFCGMTRAFTAMGHGEWHMAARQCPAGAVFYIVAIVVFALNLTALIRTVPVRISGKVLLIAGTVILLANWIYRLGMGLK